MAGGDARTERGAQASSGAETPSAAEAPNRPRALHRRRRAWRWLAGVVAVLLLLAGGAVAAIVWALHSATGTAWVLAHLPRVVATAPRGPLIGDFAADRVEVSLPGSGVVRLDGTRWEALAASAGDHGRWLHLRIASLHADRLTWLPAAQRAPVNAASRAPERLRLPIEVEVERLSVDELRIGSADAVPIRQLQARVHLGANGGAEHRLDDVAALREQLRATGSATIGADPPLAVRAHVSVATSADASLPMQAALDASGPLDRLAVTASARVTPSDRQPPQAIDATAVVRPFAPWPLGALEARAEAFDLAAFASDAPSTSLSGRAAVTTTALDQPAVIAIDLANANAGRWNEGRLPVVRVEATLRARPDAPDTIDIETLRATVGGRERAGGSIVARGRWRADAWSLAAELDGVRPAALDARAPDMTTSGTLALTGRDFAAPAVEQRTVDVVAQLTGRLADRRLLPNAPQAARLRLEARAALNAIELRTLEATLGDAMASGSGRIARDAANAPWRTSGKLRLAGFDPRPWWPGAPDALLARGPTRLNADAEFDLALPGKAGKDVYDAIAATRGRVSLRIAPSTLAGVSLEGAATFVNTDGRARPAFDLAAAGNRASGSGTLALAGSSADAWQLKVDAPALDRLAPWIAPARQQGASGAVGGALTADVRLSGRWPAIDTEGELHASAVHAPSVSVRRVDGRWRAGSAADAPVEATLDVDGAVVSGRAVERASVRLAGTARVHRGEVRIASAALPPEWADAVVSAMGTTRSTTTTTTATTATTATTTATTATATTASPSIPAPASTSAATPTSARSVVSAVIEGGLVDAGEERNAGWRGSVSELVAHSSTTPMRTWLSARALQGVVFWAGGPARATIEPGSALVLGADVRWNRIAWQAGDGGRSPHLDAQATIDPIVVSPLLRALQPGFGWGGDLAIGARIDIRSTPAVTADIVIERARGDLTVTDEVSTTPLGFTDFRLGVAARDGVWNFTAGIAGSTFGSASGAIVARTGSATAWIDASTPIDGVVQLEVAKLGTWGTWLPTGWRLDGELHASARIEGRVGAPAYSGRIEGAHISARNFLQGVDIADGAVAIALQGTTARIERLVAKGGDGTVRVEGSAAFGEAPVAELTLVAEQFRVLGRVDRRIVASGRAALRLDAKTVALNGDFKVDDGLIDFTRSDAPTLGDDVVVVRRPRASPAAEQAAAAAPAAAPAVAPAARQVDLDLRVDMGQRLRVRGRGLDAGLRGELHLTSPAGRLAVAGTLRAVDGTYQAYGQKLVIDRGVLAFAGAVENPRLDVEATRPNLDVRVGVLVTGTALAPRIRLFSEPDMSDLDKLSWLVVGRASDSVGSADTALLQAAALGLLSGEGPGVTDRLIRSIGLDEIGVRQGQGQRDTKETIVSLGKQLSKRWYVGYEQGLNATTGSWQLIYRIAQRLTVRAQAGGDNAVDLNWTLRWR